MCFLYIIALNHDNILSIVKSYIFLKCMEKEEISCLPLDIGFFFFNLFIYL